MNLYIFGYKYKSNPIICEEYYLRSFISGQTIKHNIGHYVIDDCTVLDNCTYQYFNNVTKIDTLDFLPIIKDNIDFYIDYKVNLNNYQEFYDIINMIVRSKLFILISFNDIQKGKFEECKIPCKNISDIKLDYDYGLEKVYLDPKDCDHVIDIAIAYRCKIVFKTFSVPVQKTDTLVNIYGATPIISIFGINVPLEQMINKDIAKKGYKIIGCDTMYNLPLYYFLDQYVPKEKYQMPKPIIDKYDMNTKHLISFIMSDGDNNGFLMHKIPDLMSKNRDYPVTWTISVEAPKCILNKLFTMNNYKDSYIGGCGSPPDMYNQNLLEQYMNYSKQKMEDIGFPIKNEIEMKLINACGCDCTCTSVNYNKWYKVLLYNYFKYDLKKSNNAYLVADDWLLLSSDHLLQKSYPIGKTTIIAVNINKYNISMLTDIVKQLKSKYSHIEFVNLYTLLENKFSR